jgi:hypothetical protein
METQKSGIPPLGKTMHQITTLLTGNQLTRNMCLPHSRLEWDGFLLFAVQGPHRPARHHLIDCSYPNGELYWLLHPWTHSLTEKPIGWRKTHGGQHIPFKGDTLFVAVARPYRGGFFRKSSFAGLR